ncbi:glycosyltransferase family 4 protein [bacterium]|nr:glycosyltransferase family 4 protein [bacterium]
MAKDKSILYLTTTSSMAGAEWNILNLASYMKAQGFRITIAALTGNGELLKQAQAHGMGTADLRVNKLLPFRLYGIRRLMKAHAITHSFLFHTNIPSRIFKPKDSVLINSFRSTDHWKKPVHYFLERRTASRCDLFTANFDKLSEFKVRHNILDIKYIPNAIDPASSNAAWIADHFDAALIGRFHRVKNHIKLLDEFLAHGLLKKENFRLIFYGRGPLEKVIRRKIAASGLVEKVIMRPFEHSKDKLYSGLCAVICTSEYEGFPNTLAEASIRGIPVASLPVGAAGRIIEDGVNGYLEPSINGILDRLLEMSSNEDMWKKLSQAGKEMIGSRFSPRKVHEEYLNLYRQLSGNAS